MERVFLTDHRLRVNVGLATQGSFARLVGDTYYMKHLGKLNNIVLLTALKHPPHVACLWNKHEQIITNEYLYNVVSDFI